MGESDGIDVECLCGVIVWVVKVVIGCEGSFGL